MSLETFSDDCPGCRPVILDLQGGVAKPLPDDHPLMVAAMSAWRETTLEERQGWHRFTCQNSRAAADVMAAKSVSQRMQSKMHESAAGG